MVIVSISLNDTILKEIDRIQNSVGYSGRSEVVRAGARLLISESKEKDRLTGNIDSILLLIHSQEIEDVVTEIKHRFEDITKTQIHSHLREDKCLEVFVLEHTFRTPVLKKQVFFKLFTPENYLKNSKLNPV